MRKVNTIFITLRNKRDGRQVANRIISYLENYVYTHNDIDELDKLLNVKSDDYLTSDPVITLDFKKDSIMKAKNLQAKKENYTGKDFNDEYPIKISIDKRDFEDLIKYNPSCVEDNKIFGLIVEVR